MYFLEIQGEKRMEYVHGGDIYTYKNVLDFSVNVNPFGPSEAVLEAARRGVCQAGTYPDSQCRELRERLAEKLQVVESSLIAGNGAAELFFLLVLAEKPKKALLAVPAFAEYEQALKTVDCEVEYYYLKKEQNFRITEEFVTAVEQEENCDLIFLCSPSNPAGQTIEPELLKKLICLCEEKNIRLVLDECFIDFLERPERYSMLRQVEQFKSLFLVRAFTKMHAIPGLRLGYGICSDQELLEKMYRMRQPWSVSGPAQAAGIAALEETARVEETRRFVQQERKKLEQELEKMGIRVIPSEANFFLMYSEIPLFELLLDEGILIRNCENYRGLGKGWYRMAVRRKEENEIFLRRLVNVYKKTV